MNTHQLLRYLRREIHGLDTPRKPPKRASALAPHSKPARNAKYLAWVRSLPCAACSIDPAGEAAHTGHDGGMATKSSDYSAIPLCHDCHTAGPYAYHRVGRDEFALRNAIDIPALCRRLTTLWFEARRQAC